MYTKTGDRGTTSLIGGERVAKTHPRIEAYGTIDELMAFTALLKDSLPETDQSVPYREALITILDHLMRIASHLAAEDDSIKYLPVFDKRAIEFWKRRSIGCRPRYLKFDILPFRVELPWFLCVMCVGPCVGEVSGEFVW